MRSCLLLLAAVLVLPGCAGTHVRVPHHPDRPGIIIIFIPHGRYVIDQNTETCFLGAYEPLSPVPCDKLKRNVPEAAPFITWVPDAKPPADAPASTP